MSSAICLSRSEGLFRGDGKFGDIRVARARAWQPTMRLIPWPELAVVLVMALTILGAGTLWYLGRLPLARRAGPASEPRERFLDTQRKQAQLIASCVLVVIVSIPLILRIVPPNGVYGFRVSGKRSSPAIWYAANAFMGWALSVAAVVSAILLLRLPPTAKRWWLWAAFLVPMFGAIVASFVYLNGLIQAGLPRP